MLGDEAMTNTAERLEAVVRVDRGGSAREMPLRALMDSYVHDTQLFELLGALRRDQSLALDSDTTVVRVR